ncbi:hypothetical protein NUU61_008889 [Penicillium alfredii]|uniref:Ubiquitin-like domain-containing protein n=1 Tax=Penicillium alfredii TaxID=1506179 RepID=A0A9W9EM78_9EURO|nr:uncharacterized protein NUU61_008889 [Penicillium alfredii]KAJ5084310.1 hypothetical protein NUU61_008889 [Penicillium alfredii]
MPSFFKKPSWAITGTEATGTEFYRRSEQTYSDIVAANRDAHKPKPGSDSIEADGRRHKRLRLSDEGSAQESLPALHGEEHESESPGTPRKSAANFDKRGRPLEKTGLDQDDKPLETNVTRVSGPYYLADNPVDTDPGDSPLPSTPHPVMPQTLKPINDTYKSTTGSVPWEPSSSFASPPEKPSGPTADDPVVQILITSEIANSKPLLVHRKMSQSLRDVRLAWCKRQSFVPETQPSIYLTWKGRRLFDVTTCRSLGIKTKGMIAELPGMDDDTNVAQELRIHMEAVSDSPIAGRRQSPSPSTGGISPAPHKTEDEEQNEPMKLILRSPGLNDFKIKARQKTMVSRLISAFRDKQDISPDDHVSLVFDGDKLDPDTCLGEHDITDLDLVDVQVTKRT